MNRGITSALVSMDPSNAFERIIGMKLLKQLSDEFKFIGHQTSGLLIYSNLTDRRQFVSFSGRMSH